LHPIINATCNLCGTTIIKLAHFLLSHIRNIKSVGHIINKQNVQWTLTCWKGKHLHHTKCHMCSH
jgi:hypothetical protein